jgi:hypothetical protein
VPLTHTLFELLGVLQFSDQSLHQVAVLGSRDTLTFTVTRSQGLYRSVSVDWQVPSSPRLQPPYSGTLIYAPGEASRTFSITVSPDAIPRLPQEFTVSLSNIVGAALGVQSTAIMEIAAHNNPYGVFAITSVQLAVNGADR